MFVYAGTSRRSPYGSRTSVRLRHDLGGSLALRVLRLQRRLWTCSHLHQQLCLPLLIQRSPLDLSSLALYPKGHTPIARLLVIPHFDLGALVPVIQFPSPTLSFNHAFRSPLSLHKPRFGGDRSIHPEDLWKHIPSSPAQPALSSPDVSPDTGTPSRRSRLLVQRPRTLEWACARSAKRRRTNPDDVYHEDGETDSEFNAIDDPGACCPSFSISEPRVPLEFYDKYPLDVVHGAVLLLGLRDAAVDLEL